METEKVKIQIWKPHINQLPIAKSKKQYKFLRCGRRFGKTQLLVGTLIENALEFPNTTHFYVGPTYKQAKMIAWKMLMKMTQERVPAQLVHKINESELFVEVGNNSRVWIKGQDDPDSLRGVALKSAALDEYKDFREDTFKEIIEPSLLDLNGLLYIAGTPKGFNHMYRLELEARNDPETWDIFHFTTYDNPFMSHERIEKIKARHAKAGTMATFEQEYLGEYRKFEGLVYKEFDYDRHVFTGPIPDKEWIETIAGVDFGFTNPMASNIIKIDKDKHFWVSPKFYYRREKLTRDLIEWCKGAGVEENVIAYYPDPAEPDRIQEMKDAGLNCRESNKAVAHGINRVRQILRENRLHISSNCVDLISEFEGYSYPKNREGYNDTEEPQKKHDHALDALRMAIYTCDPQEVQNETSDDFNLYGTNYR